MLRGIGTTYNSFIHSTLQICWVFNNDFSRCLIYINNRYSSINLVLLIVLFILTEVFVYSFRIFSPHNEFYKDCIQFKHDQHEERSVRYVNPFIKNSRQSKTKELFGKTMKGKFIELLKSFLKSNSTLLAERISIKRRVILLEYSK